MHFYTIKRRLYPFSKESLPFQREKRCFVPLKIFHRHKKFSSSCSKTFLRKVFFVQSLSLFEPNSDLLLQHGDKRWNNFWTAFRFAGSPKVFLASSCLQVEARGCQRTKVHERPLASPAVHEHSPLTTEPLLRMATKAFCILQKLVLLLYKGVKLVVWQAKTLFIP